MGLSRRLLAMVAGLLLVLAASGCAKAPGAPGAKPSDTSPTSGASATAPPASRDATPAETAFDALVRRTQAFAGRRVAALDRSLPAGKYTHYTLPDGSWRQVGPDYWTAGYLPGELWLEYERTGDPKVRARAEARQAPMAAEVGGLDSGVRYFHSYANGYRLTGDTKMREVALKAAAATAARYSPRLHMVRSRDAKDGFQVVVDEIMNLQLLFWGAENGGPSEWRDRATEHALTVRREFVRPDGTTYHLIVFDERTGRVKEHRGGQGAAPESTWSRGQAWAIYGFANAYRKTKDPRFLETARLVADRFLADLPADRVPYWDFEALGIPDEPRDTSASAIAASGLLDLATLDTDAKRRERYAAEARAIVASLASPRYLATGARDQTILAHGTYDKPTGRFDTGLAFGDFFFLEAMSRLRALPQTTGG